MTFSEPKVKAGNIKPPSHIQCKIPSNSTKNWHIITLIAAIAILAIAMGSAGGVISSTLPLTTKFLITSALFITFVAAIPLITRSSLFLINHHNQKRNKIITKEAKASQAATAAIVYNSMLTLTGIILIILASIPALSQIAILSETLGFSLLLAGSSSLIKNIQTKLEIKNKNNPPDIDKNKQKKAMQIIFGILAILSIAAIITTNVVDMNKMISTPIKIVSGTVAGISFKNIADTLLGTLQGKKPTPPIKTPDMSDSEFEELQKQYQIQVLKKERKQAAIAAGSCCAIMLVSIVLFMVPSLVADKTLSLNLAQTLGSFSSILAKMAGGMAVLKLADFIFSTKKLKHVKNQNIAVESIPLKDKTAAEIELETAKKTEKEEATTRAWYRTVLIGSGVMALASIMLMILPLLVPSLSVNIADSLHKSSLIMFSCSMLPLLDSLISYLFLKIKRIRAYRIRNNKQKKLATTTYAETAF